MAKKNKTGIGIAGEAYVEAELSKRGYAAGVTKKNTPSVDILAANGVKAKMIQVKTNSAAKKLSLFIFCKNPSNNFYMHRSLPLEPG
jgi:Holliday junction resolvase